MKRWHNEWGRGDDKGERGLRREVLRREVIRGDEMTRGVRDDINRKGDN